LTTDGCSTWFTAATPPKGFRLAVADLPDRKIWIAVDTSGSDMSADDGKSWKLIDTGNYNAVSFASSKAGWAVGPGGRIAKFTWGML
jgi:hypothetical protein